MKEYKIRQEIYHRLSTEHRDDLKNFSVELVDDIAGTAVRYFRERDIGWLYPGKSYAVAVLYARWLAEEFGEDFYAALDDAELLYNNDPYFVPYSKDPANYDLVIAAVPEDMTQGMIPDIRQYFVEEFMLCDGE